MREHREIVNTVWSFLDRAADLHAASARERFVDAMHSQMLERGMESPLEDLFWIACSVLCLGYLNPDQDPNYGWPSGVYLDAQVVIGDYRVDFVLRRVVSKNAFDPVQPAPVVVELDGHDFHDKDRRQRGYEKARDRYLVREGYRILHFTGSEVVADPLKVAYEALQLVGLRAGVDYEPSNPLDLDPS